MIDKRDVQAFLTGWHRTGTRAWCGMRRSSPGYWITPGYARAARGAGRGLRHRQVLFGDYVKRGAARVTAVDLSPEMAARAAEKAAGTQITVVCSDVEDSAAVRDSGGPYDVVMVYNAFRTFPIRRG